MAVADGAGLPLAIHVGSAAPHEVTLVEATLDACFAPALPERLIGDKAYDSDPLDRRLQSERGITLIAPHRRDRRRATLGCAPPVPFPRPCDAAQGSAAQTQPLDERLVPLGTGPP